MLGPGARWRLTKFGIGKAALVLIAVLLLSWSPVSTAQAQSSDATLSALTISGVTLDSSFTSATKTYTASVTSDVPWLTVTPTATDSGATIAVNTPVLSSAVAVASGSASELLLLNVGANAITIVVTAADTTTSETYTVTVTRAGTGCRAAGKPRLVAECETLLGLKDELRGSGSLNWASNVRMSSWRGIKLEIIDTIVGADNYRVTDIALPNRSLTGEIPPELGSLPNLLELHLNNNQLTGEIPPELAKVPRLWRLSLNNNQLTGAIPPQLGSLSSLQLLYLNNNQLSGEIPPELGSLGKLTKLYLEKNQLTGAIPPELGNLPLLVELDLNNNQLSGEIPPELGKLKDSLTILYLYNNQLTGEIPLKLTELYKLKAIAIQNNQLTGEIPSDFKLFFAMEAIYLGGNQLTGEIPPELGLLEKLETLRLGGNQLTGEIPSELGRLSAKLETLDLSCNQLTGGIPSRLGTITTLDKVELQGNPLTSTDLPSGLSADKVRFSGAIVSGNSRFSRESWCGPPFFREGADLNLRVLDGKSGAILVIRAIDPDNWPSRTGSISYVLRGDGDHGYFGYNASSGRFSPSSALDYANPVDQNADNVYEMRLVATSSGESVSINITITVLPIPTAVNMGASTLYDSGGGGITGAAAVGSDGITLNWRAPTNIGTISGYRILRREISDSPFTAYVEIHDTMYDMEPTETTYTDPNTSVEAGKTYFYRVKPVLSTCQTGPDWYNGNGDGWPDTRNFGRATASAHTETLVVPDVHAHTPTIPLMGDGTDAGGSDDGKTNGAVASDDGITLTWAPPSNAGQEGTRAALKGYIILRRVDGVREADETAVIDDKHLAGSDHKYREVHNTLTDRDPKALTWLDRASGLTSGTTYLYRVRAINNYCYISPDPTRHNQTGYSFGDTNFGKATAN